MNSFFETSKKAKTRRRGLLVWIFRATFNLALVLAVTVVVGLTGLYVYLSQEYRVRLDRQYPELVQNSHV